MNRAGSNSKSQQHIAKASVPLLSYKAEIIWDPQPPYTDEWNEYKQQQAAIRAKKTSALLSNLRSQSQ